jgi:hypothetical protein
MGPQLDRCLSFGRRDNGEQDKRLHGELNHENRVEIRAADYMLLIWLYI